MTRRRIFHSLGVIGALALIILAIVLFVPTQGAASAQGTNYLVNPGFETPFVADWRPDGGGFVAHGWRAWWINDSSQQFAGPEYKQVQIAIDPSRVRSGQNAQQYFKPWSRHYGGLYQRVAVPNGATMTFAIYGHAWSAFCRPIDGGLDCDPNNSFYGEGANPINMKVGIDPYGGTNPFSPNIVWSAPRNVYDHYELFAVSARAQGNVVTVFTQSTPEWAAPVVNVYWDDATLFQGTLPAPAPPPPPPPAPAPSNPVPSGNVSATTATPINFRTGPSTGYTVITTLPGGVTVPVLGRNADASWIYVDRSGTRGWLAAWLCAISGNLNGVPVVDANGGGASPAPSNPVPSGNVTATANYNLRIRQGPSTNYTQTGILGDGATVPVLGRNADNSWLYIQKGSLRGWVAGWLTTISGNINSVPRVDANGNPVSYIGAGDAQELTGFESLTVLLGQAANEIAP